MLKDNTVIIVKFSNKLGRILWVYACGKKAKEWNHLLDINHELVRTHLNEYYKLLNCLVNKWGATRIATSRREYKIDSIEWACQEAWLIDNSKLTVDPYGYKGGD